jgi:hypothetical protein
MTIAATGEPQRLGTVANPGPVALGTATSTLYSAPAAGGRMILRTIVLANSATATAGVACSIGIGGLAAANLILVTTVSASATTVTSVDVPLQAGDNVVGGAATGAVVACTLGGELVA